MIRPIIGITTQTLDEIPDQIPQSWIMRQRYVEVLTALGAVPWLIPLDQTADTLRSIFERLDGLFLPGGVDIGPTSYGQEKTALCQRTDPSRDETELTLARWAVDEHVPVLAVCRGEQIVNVALGGDLWQDIAAQRPHSIRHDYAPLKGQFTREYLAHDVRVVAGTLLARIVGAPTLAVNSMHHQGIKSLGRGLVASAVAPDGLIEAVEADGDQWVVGVQWHPESLVDGDAHMRAIYDAFIDASCEHAASDRALANSRA